MLFLLGTCLEPDGINHPMKNVNVSSQLETSYHEKNSDTHWVNTHVQLEFIQGGSFITPALLRARLRQEISIWAAFSPWVQPLGSWYYMGICDPISHPDQSTSLPFLLVHKWLFKSRLQVCQGTEEYFEEKHQLQC